MIAHINDIVKQNADYTFFPWAAQQAVRPLHIKSSKGVFLTDTNGKKYLDFSSQYLNVNIGHSDERVLAAIERQMRSFSYISPSCATDIRGELGYRLASILPGDLNKTLFTLGGSDANDVAIQIARKYTGRSRIMTFRRSYHGATLLSLSVSGDPRRNIISGQLLDLNVQVENPYFYRCPWGSTTEQECADFCIAAMESALLENDPATFAAILVEGESGSSGCIKYPPFFLKQVRQLCNRYNVLLIADEVLSGFGRTGKMFAVGHHGICPDILTMAKGLTAGYVPLGGVAVSDSIAATFDYAPSPGGITCSAHPLGCAAALAVLDIYKKDQLVAAAAAMGEYMRVELDSLADKHPSIGDIRLNGLLGCIELVKNRQSRAPMATPHSSPKEMEAMNRVAAALLDEGLFTIVRWNYLFISPPLCITREQIDTALGIISRALEIADKYCS
ncbi:aminotransferase class III-fold pyridoxal phosphate-dependent enzyme [Chitinophaga varians]|uniref:Aminotransferase class III-fold pyridoxal phosphate-dependent enzyme n=1 Tax=Chitinophaga varians TaxID=2202339 RepID=A0A847S280_9BACT|nr:aminotransferase class III-fold pyridoxal phosphate-dependent enzyme [Chitinophaga varians]NLR68494.1 aminotransferase class III-fold pyridoxal phosphate-dependent enzyme [Chitinophaga varians]